MNPGAPHTGRRLARELGWLGTLAAFVALLFSAAIVKLEANKASVQTLREEVQRQSALLRSLTLPATAQEELRALEAALAECTESATVQARRIAAISSAAKGAGVTLLSLSDAGQREREDAWVVSHSHNVLGIGSQRQIAAFLDALCGGAGAVAVENLEIGRDEETGSGLLQASMQITWFAPGASSGLDEEVSQ